MAKPHIRSPIAASKEAKQFQELHIAGGWISRGPRSVSTTDDVLLLQLPGVCLRGIEDSSGVYIGKSIVNYLRHGKLLLQLPGVGEVGPARSPPESLDVQQLRVKILVKL